MTAATDSSSRSQRSTRGSENLNLNGHISTNQHASVLKVLLHCDGCVSKVKRHIRKLEGVESFHVDQKNSKVTVYGTASPQAVLDKVLRAGKTAEFWPLPAKEVDDVATTAEEDVVGEKTKTKTKKTKASDAGGNVSKKQKNGNKSKPEHPEETEQLEDDFFGDGEIVDEAEANGESDERVLITSKQPTKKRVFRKG